MRRPALLREDVKMRYSLPVLALALGLAACGSTNDQAPAFRGGAGGDAAYGRGLQALDDGNIGQANEYFACAAQFGGGYEVAWYYAGTTALDLAEAGGPEAEAYREEGVYYLTTSGNAGWGASQAALARYYHDRGNAQEAVYWTMLYTNNVREMSLGLTRMGTGLIADIRDSVPAETFAEIQNRAVHFIPEAIPVGRPGEECNAAIQGNRETRSRRQRPAPQPPTSQPGSQRRQPGSPY
ncbi:MAG: hypothetical protein COW29_01160 [Rhodobacterales bacterium CG15_BIG_FIL_POST_REV_8_21_14_020_59_13]|nr:MAG: hypothetical protein COW29_01160 [Rhodobacterales bacterium CG15_BIG_FIL_POST_REV_8_21_14_020_59_13]